MLKKLLSILRDKVVGKKKDYFLNAKYFEIAQFYGNAVLDVGAGNGDFSKFLKSQSHQVKAIDITAESKHPDLDFTLFDGITIPFPDKSMDTCICMFVLHHTNNQEELIREMKRVSAKYIVIGEDIINNSFDILLGKIHLNTAPWAKGDNSFRTNQGWLNLFEQLGLRLVTRQIINRSEYLVYPVQRIVYVLAV